MPRSGPRCVRSPRIDRPCRFATLPRWSACFRTAARAGPAGAIPGTLARFVPTFLTDAAEPPRKNLRLDSHGDPWVAVYHVRLLRHGAGPVRSEERRVGHGCGRKCRYWWSTVAIKRKAERY